MSLRSRMSSTVGTPIRGVSDDERRAGKHEVEDHILDMILAQTDEPEANVREGRRGILIVASRAVHVQNWINASGVGAEAYVEFDGTPSPTSQLRPVKAYVKVVADDKPVRRPSFDDTRGWIRLEVHRKDQEALLAIVEQPKWYCWYWEVAGSESVYAGVHSGG